MDLDETSFDLDNVEIEDDVAVHDDLVREDHVGVDFEVSLDSLPPPPVDEEKKKEFERKRDEILSGVPEEVKSKFGEIYFSSFGKIVGPALIMSPYMVEPGPLRDQWLSMYHNVSNCRMYCCFYVAFFFRKLNNPLFPNVICISTVQKCWKGIEYDTPDILVRIFRRPSYCILIPKDVSTHPLRGRDEKDRKETE